MGAKLSVIVPIFNVEKYIKQCIDSILNQSMHEIELILVDDGSPDNCGSICDEYARKDTRVKCIHQKNSGLLLARRNGLLASTGDYIAFVDGDDFVAPDSYIFAEKAMEDGLDIVIFNFFEYYSEQDQRLNTCSYPEGRYDKAAIQKSIWPDMIWNCDRKISGLPGSLWNKIIKRTLAEVAYKRLKFFDFYKAEDAAVFFPMMKEAKTIEIKPQPIYFYRKYEKSFIPAYISEPSFFDKMYHLYCHFRDVFQDEPVFTKQIEYLYLYTLTQRRWIYEGRGADLEVIFPFDKVEKGEDIVVYGAGTVGQKYIRLLRQVPYCNVVLWVDQKWRNYSNAQVSPVEKVKTVSFDKIVIAILNEQTKNLVRKELMDMDVAPQKIVT